MVELDGRDRDVLEVLADGGPGDSFDDVLRALLKQEHEEAREAEAVE